MPSSPLSLGMTFTLATSEWIPIFPHWILGQPLDLPVFRWVWAPVQGRLSRGRTGSAGGWTAAPARTPGRARRRPGTASSAACSSSALPPPPPPPAAPDRSPSSHPSAAAAHRSLQKKIWIQLLSHWNHPSTREGVKIAVVRIPNVEVNPNLNHENYNLAVLRVDAHKQRCFCYCAGLIKKARLCKLRVCHWGGVECVLLRNHGGGVDPARFFFFQIRWKQGAYIYINNQFVFFCVGHKSGKISFICGQTSFSLLYVALRHQQWELVRHLPGNYLLCHLELPLLQVNPGNHNCKHPSLEHHHPGRKETLSQPAERRTMLLETRGVLSVGNQKRLWGHSTFWSCRVVFNLTIFVDKRAQHHNPSNSVKTKMRTLCLRRIQLLRGKLRTNLLGI